MTDEMLAKLNGMLERGQLDQAEQMLLRMVKKEPDDAIALDMLGQVYLKKLFKERAVYYAKEAHQRMPGDIPIAIHLANAYEVSDQTGDAAKVLEAMIPKFPMDTELRYRAVHLLLDAKRLVDARRTIDEGLALQPEHTGLLHALARYFHRVGDSDRAVDTLLKIQKVRFEEPGLFSSLASALNYHPGATPQQQLSAHMAFGRLIGLGQQAEPLEHPRGTNPEKKLRIGLVSPDFRGHSVAFFLDAILDHLDREKFSIHCYYTYDRADAFTARIQERADSFVVSLRANDAQLGKKIYDDKIDILIELCGLFNGNNLRTMYLKPAPVQASWLGYPNTTGIKGIDYRIVDSITDPPTTERYTTERLVRIDPCFLCYKPQPEYMMIEPGPARRTGPFTFGSFNAAMKLSSAVLGFWARMLAGVPDSRLLIKASGMEEEPVRDSLRERMERVGIDLGRVTIVGRTPDSLGHMTMYRDVDLALDTWPYHGTTTTFEALFMGVPVLTLTGTTHASRVGASILTNLGFPELVTHSADEYVARAIAFGHDRAALEPYRADLRGKLLFSPLCDGKAFAGRFGEALRRMWLAHCEGKKIEV